MSFESTRLWIVRIAALLLLSTAGAGALTAQEQVAAEVESTVEVEAPDSAEDAASPAPAKGATHQIPRTEGEVKVDAVLDEAVWAEALVLPLLYETRPGENIDPPVQTECLVAYGGSFVYVAFRASDPDPSEIRARLSDRDSAFNDDFVGVVFDTFNDERRGFEFFVNPLGVQMDLFNDDVGGNETSSWDAIWDSAGKITETGYVVEMAIPFNQLRFPPSQQEQTWGFDALRFYPRSQRHRIALQPMDRDISCYLCQVSKLEGFEGISPGKNMEFVPTVTSGRTDSRPEFPLGSLVDGGVDSDVGVTARWGVTPNLTLNGAINPDFSQVEADSGQLDVNNQFALFFPERRPFFLEGADLFRTDLQAVFTRNVADPDFGLKLSGKQGKNAFGVFYAQDSKTNLLFPGSQRSRADSFDFESDDMALRYRRDFGSSSAVGVLFTGREGGGYSNYVGGVDGKYRFRDTDSLRFQFLRSETQYPSQIVTDFKQPSGSFSDDAFRLRYNHDSRNLFVYAQYQDVGSQFRADLGFMPRVGSSFILGGFNRHWWGDEENWWTRFTVGGDWDLTEDEEGNALEREFETWFEFQGPRQSYFWFDVGQRDRFFNGVNFEDQGFVNTYFEFQPSGSVFVGFFGHKGKGIDFANTREGDVIQLEPSFRVNLGLHLKANLDHTHQTLDVEGGNLFKADLTQLRLVYQFNVRTFVRSIFQYRTVDRNPALYENEVDPESEGLFSQLLFSYKINPQTVLFLGYSDNRSGDQAISLTQRDRSIFLKFGYAWVL